MYIYMYRLKQCQEDPKAWEEGKAQSTASATEFKLQASSRLNDVMARDTIIRMQIGVAYEVLGLY